MEGERVAADPSVTEVRPCRILIEADDGLRATLGDHPALERDVLVLWVAMFAFSFGY